MTYDEILSRRRQFSGDSGFEAAWFPDKIFPFQRSLVEWACLKGRAALFEDVGLGKSIQQLTWAQNVIMRTNKPVLLLTPLSVGPQMVKEGRKFGVDTVRSKDGKHDGKARVVVANYQRLHMFSANDFSGIVCDESSILKNADGETRQAVIDFARRMPYRLLATATPSPNDLIELGNSSEALGYMGFQDMITRFFKKVDEKARNSRKDENRGENWRFRGHAGGEFWRWVTSWARAVRKPSDMGFSDDGYILPPLDVRQHIVQAGSRPDGFLFDMPAVGWKEQRSARNRSVQQRCEMAAELCVAHPSSLAWCYLNPEGDLLEKLIPDSVQISGADSDDAKEEKIEAFLSGQAKRLVSKPSVCGFGLNFQHCAHQTFFPSHSYEAYHQCVGRSLRFGQKKRVRIDIITSEAESHVLENLERKTRQAETMFENLVKLMHHSESFSIDRTHKNEIKTPPCLTA